MTQVDRIPLARLYVAPENARFGAQDLGDLDALAASILEVEDLIDPLHVYGPDDDGNFAVWDGGRRWHALMKLVKGKKTKLPPALAEGVPCLISTREAALLHSLATFNREQMHPADEFLAYKRMFDSGMEPQRIAAACAVPAPRVRQLLRLNGVAPEVLDAFKGGELALDVVEAFTLSLDHAKQRTVLEAIRQKGRATSAHEVKQAFRTDAEDGDGLVAKFVGREAYEAAGGTFLCDLFDDQEDWADGALARRLFDEKLAALVAEIEAEGWGVVKYASYSDYNYASGFDLQREPKDGWTAEFKAAAMAVIKQGYTGDMEVKRGYVKPNRATGATGAAALKPDQDLFGWSHKGHGIMTHVATQATAAALVADPGAAYDALLTHMVLATLFEYSADQDASRLRQETRWGTPDSVETALDGEYDAMGEAWKLRLAPFTKPDKYTRACTDVTGLCDFLGALEPGEKAQLLALCFARTLWAWEGKSNEHKPERWAHLGWMARRANLNMAAAWTPDAEFLKGGSKDALLGALKDQGHTGTWNTAPKKEMVGTVAATAKRDRWLPKLLRDLTPPVRANPDEATVETLTEAELLILAEVHHKSRKDSYAYRTSDEGPFQHVVLIQDLTPDEREALRPLMWGGFLSLVAVTPGPAVKPSELLEDAVKRLALPKVQTPYQTRWLNPAEAPAEPKAKRGRKAQDAPASGDDDGDLSPAMVALATGKAKPIREPEGEDA